MNLAGLILLPGKQARGRSQAMTCLPAPPSYSLEPSLEVGQPDTGIHSPKWKALSTDVDLRSS